MCVGFDCHSDRGGSRISKEGVQMKKSGVCLPDFTQNIAKYPMKMK